MIRIIHILRKAPGLPRYFQFDFRGVARQERHTFIIPAKVRIGGMKNGGPENPYPPFPASAGVGSSITGQKFLHSIVLDFLEFHLQF